MASREPRENNDNEGTVSDLSEVPSCSYILGEAECSEIDSEDESDGSVPVDLVDDASVEQGESLSLFVAQALQEHELEIQGLKRKFIKSPSQVQNECAALSPKLAECSLDENRGKKARRSLFSDSGIETSTVETTEITENTGTLSSDTTNISQPQATEPQKDLEAIFRCKNRLSYMLGRFRETVGVSFSDITRPFKNSKTASSLWVIALYYHTLDTELNALFVLLKPQCQFVFVEDHSGVVFIFADFHVQKCRATIFKWFTTNFSYNENKLLADPPRVRSGPAAIFYIQKFQKPGALRHGEIPDFIKEQCSLSSQLPVPFELSKMVQWAYDNNYTEEHQIALQYAMFADVDQNAKAFLRLNNQPKAVKDCQYMVRLYQQALTANMTISQFLDACCKEHGDPIENKWRDIIHLLRYQGTEFLQFMHVMLDFVHHTPKKCTMVICGPSNTGKSYFAASLNKFMKGHVLSFVNHGSHFWLSPIRGARVCLLDDATITFWRYADSFLRTMLDGNEISIDAKHRNPMQSRAPPMIITTNEDIKRKDEFSYLSTRTRFIYFNKPFPLRADGTPVYQIDSLTWTSFFRRFWRHLNLRDPDEEADGETTGPLRLYTEQDSGSV